MRHEQVVQYLPNFFFAALLMLLGVEITLDWLILSVRKVSRAEYCLLLASFLAILQREPAALHLCLTYHESQTGDSCNLRPRW